MPEGAARRASGTRIAIREVLLADDDPTSDGAVAVLADAGLLVHVVTPVEAAAWIRDRLPVLALIAVGGPHCDGALAARSLRQDPPYQVVPLVALVGAGTHAPLPFETLRLFDAYVRKPLDGSVTLTLGAALAQSALALRRG